uniref:Putative secreted protein n=1 Tax=Ixodes scapularis TaxID=6945 RepID=A0A4D5RCP6_IXOSC
MLMLSATFFFLSSRSSRWTISSRRNAWGLALFNLLNIIFTRFRCFLCVETNKTGKKKKKKTKIKSHLFTV